MLEYFFHFCQSDFGNLRGLGEMGWLAAGKSAGRQRISATSPIYVAFLPCSAAGRQRISTTSPIYVAFLPRSAVKRQRISATSPIYVALTPTLPKTNFFAKPIVTPPLVWYNTGYHRMFSGMLAWLGTSFETLVQSTGMEI